MRMKIYKQQILIPASEKRMPAKEQKAQDGAQEVPKW